MGYHRADGSVGTANYWLVIPMVFCENRNLEVLQEALVNDLGYGRNQSYAMQAHQLIEIYRAGKDVDDILNAACAGRRTQIASQQRYSPMLMV